jgi:hypothetical protein
LGRLTTHEYLELSSVNAGGAAAYRELTSVIDAAPPGGIRAFADVVCQCSKRILRRDGIFTEIIMKLNDCLIVLIKLVISDD